MNGVYAALLVLLIIAIFGVVWYRKRNRGIDPIKLLLRQAAKLNWRKTAEIKEDGQGAAWAQRSIHFARGKEEAVLWLKNADITLIRDYAPPPNFEDFVELEQWIKENPRETDADHATGEKLYLRRLERFVTRQGYFSRLLEASATDKPFFMALYAFHKTGYAIGETPEVVAALTLDALIRYGKNRDEGLRFLARLENDFKASAKNN